MGCLANAERRALFVVVMHVSDLLFIMIYITSLYVTVVDEVRCDDMLHM